MKKLLTILAILAPMSLEAATFDWEYMYGNPYDAASQTYITSTSNAVLYTEGTVRLWKPIVGASTEAATTPGIINYHFDFGQATTDLLLWMNMPTFHWSYSRGHNFLYGSTDGATWTQLAEVTTPAFGTAHDLGTVTLPGSFLGTSELYLRVELFSFGPSASVGSVLTNTAQLSRYDVNARNTAFRLQANFQPTASAPEPGTISLGLLGLMGVGLSRRRKG